jgi:LuxR family transcriptional regulator, maltose regulon positive regulatory protein
VSAVVLARVWTSLGRLSDASEVTANARTYLPSDSESVLLGLLDAVDARVALAGGDVGRAGDIIAGLERGPRRSRLEARLHLARDEPDRAVASLDQHQPATRRAEVDSLLLRARCAHDLRAPDAEAALGAALGAARPELFTFAVAEELHPLAPRVGLLLRSQPLDPFAESVLELFDTVVEPLIQTTADTLVDPLTERELTVLRYLGSHLTLAQIASELYLSVNTVKTHSKAVHRKLAVASRHDAVVEARRLGIR